MASKNYLITGACRGIGRGLTRLLLQKGHRVFLVDNNEIEIAHMRTQLPKWLPSSTSSTSTSTSASSSTQAVATTSSQWQIFKADLSRQNEIQSAANSASNFFNGRLDVLINNAAYTSGVIHETKFDSDSFLDLWNRSMTVNLTGSMLMSRACLPMLKKRSESAAGDQKQQQPRRDHGGSIIFMSSTRAYQSELFSEAYATTKAGLLGLTQALSCSLAEDGVKVNAILPGWINVMHESKQGDEKGARWEDGLSPDDQKWHFAGRVGRVEDILRAVEFLAQTDQDGDGFITGQEIVVDGGVTRKMVYPE